jgi:broad specificity phosphatase PhoE
MQVFLIRHGEVDNPDHVVYADLPGFGLSTNGREQAAAAATRLSNADVTLVVSSPLRRAVETAAAIAAACGCEVVADERLTEWRLSSRWAGTPWGALPSVFPGELEAYLGNPEDLPFSPESLRALAERVGNAVTDWWKQAGGQIAFVSHQDPIHAGCRVLTAAGFADYHSAKPEHCSISTLARQSPHWQLTEYWAPHQ